MRYNKITLELIVVAETAEDVTRDLHTMLDALDEKHTIFGGTVETSPFEHNQPQAQSALTHTVNGSATALKAARKGLTTALRSVI